MAHDPSGDGGHLGWRLALAEDDLREALPGGPVMIDPGESQVLERLGAEPLQQLGLDRLDRHLAPLQAVEQVVEFVGIHRSRSRRLKESRATAIMNDCAIRHNFTRAKRL